MRLVSRLTTEFALMNLRLSLRLLPGRLETSIVAQALLRGALPHLVGTHGPELPTATPLIGSVGSIARSFDRSPETMRRHVQVLVTEGFFVVEPGGVRLAPTSEAGSRILEYLRGVHDNMLWLVEELDSWGLVTRKMANAPGITISNPVAHGAHTQAIPPLALILRAALDLRLLGFDTFKGVSSWTSLAVWNTLSAVSVRHITTNRQLCSLYRQRSTPDTLRRPISVRALSGVSGLPYATIRRHLADLELAGRVGRKGNGYVMLTGQLMTSDIERRVVAYVSNALDRVDTLVAKAIDPAAIPSMYIGARPVLVPVR